jgi:hypothetical protein
MKTFRTDKTQLAYDEYKKNPDVSATGCWICDKESIREFKLWRIVENSFPYDKIATRHHMITTIRHAPESDVTEEEWLEFAEIKLNFLYKEYEYVMQATPKVQSIPGHYHLHLLDA